MSRLHRSKDVTLILERLVALGCEVRPGGHGLWLTGPQGVHLPIPASPRNERAVTARLRTIERKLSKKSYP